MKLLTFILLLLLAQCSIGQTYTSQTTANYRAGSDAGAALTTGHSNTFVGALAGRSTTTGSYNSYFGGASGQYFTTGSYNTFIGFQAGASFARGTQTGWIAGSGKFNTAVGYAAGKKLHTANSNSIFGFEAGYYNEAGNSNTFMGYRAGYSNISGNYNCFLGTSAGLKNTTGGFNTAAGFRALQANTTGSYNTAYGVDALVANTTGYNNTAVGIDALSNNLTGFSNTATGLNSIFRNTSGYNNTANGKEALFNNTTGFNNTAVGTQALIDNTTGSRNTAVGDSAGAQFNSTYSSFIGYKTSVTITGLTNVTVLGHRASATASNQVRIGNTSVTSIGGKVGWSTLSDGRFKDDIKNDVPGLDLINKLTPVTYVVNQKKLQAALKSSNEPVNSNGLKRQTGFIAQEVEKVAKELNYEFSAVDAPQNENDLYGLRYAEFVVPLVKAVQQLDSANKEKEERLAKLEEEIIELKELIGRLGGQLPTERKGWIKQNTPNPVRNSTTIQYYTPEDAKYALILFMNTARQQLRSYNVNGGGTINFSTGTLPSGTYTYSLVVDGKTISTKKMVIAR